MAVALITGCSSGIGLRSALEMARRGHRVFASMRNLESAHYLRDKADNEQLSVEIIQLDVTDIDSVAAAIAHVTERGGRLDVVVNNAGFGSFGPVEDCSDEDLKQVFETNFFGAIRVTRAALPTLRAQRRGTIIMVSSVSGLRTFPFLSVYSASKFALEAIGNGLRYELRPFGIRVVLVEPGNFTTRAGVNMHYPKRLIGGFAKGTSDPEYERIWKQFSTATGNLPFGDAGDVAKVIADAAEAENPQARYLVGKDAGQAVALSLEDFERATIKKMGVLE
jgi:NAD(P)-dependent dehydrogenase (short-subunit alcohol dehydrogenase family)